jgi:glutathione S-transferase
MAATLVTIPFSHYCEKARWALERAAIGFDEVGHLPVFSRLGTARYGRWSSVPVLVADGEALADSTAILQWIGRRGGRFEPYPEPVAGEALAWEERFDDKLGPHTRRVGYSWLLSERALLRDLVGQARVPAVEKALARASLPAMTAFLRRGLKIDAAGVERSLGRIDEGFAAVADRLADGRRYLCGDALTAADLTFAALAAPVLHPERYGAPLPPVERLSPEARATIDRLRAHPAGAFALRLYREDR